METGNRKRGTAIVTGTLCAPHEKNPPKKESPKESALIDFNIGGSFMTQEKHLLRLRLLRLLRRRRLYDPSIGVSLAEQMKKKKKKRGKRK